MEMELELESRVRVLRGRGCEVEVVGQVEDGGRTEDGWWFIILGLLELEISFLGLGGAKPSIDTRGSRGQQTYLDGVFIQAEFTFIPNQTKFQYGLGALLNN
jgi:hypothetical protein